MCGPMPTTMSRRGQRDEELYSVKLFLTRGKWDSRCTCDVRVSCKTRAAPPPSPGFPTSMSRSAWTIRSAAPATAKFARAPPRRKFPSATNGRRSWLKNSAVRSPRSGRGRQLANLAALYAEFVQSHHTLYPGAITRHGFEHTPAQGVPDYVRRFCRLVGTRPLTGRSLGTLAVHCSRLRTRRSSDSRSFPSDD